MAQRCDRQVEDLSARTADRQVFANPDGTRELRAYAQPRWAKRPSGEWAPIDTTLRVEAGRVVPGNVVVPISFSNGGDGAFATIGVQGKQLSMGWQSRLPTPVLEGDSAVYPNVLPDVDLRVTARPFGFSETLVVKSRQAALHPALSKVSFALAGNGVTVSAAADGGAQAKDANGTVVFQSPAPVMWDSRGAQSNARSGTVAQTAETTLPRIAAMAQEVSSERVAVIPDKAMLSDPDTVYPVFVDPEWQRALESNVWKVVASRSDVAGSSTFALNNGATRGDAGSGRTCDGTVVNGSCPSPGYYQVRTMFRMALPDLSAKRVIQATFNITQKWSSTCNPLSDARLWVTGGISSSTSWNTQPSWIGPTADASANHRVDSGAGCAGQGNVAFNATNMVSTAQANGWTDLTLGLRAIDEGTMNQWKRFDRTTASLSIVFNSYPNLPDTLTTHGQACATGAAQPVVAVTAPTLSARVTDPDGAGEGDISGTLQGEFAWEAWNGTVWNAVGSGSGTPQAGGTTNPSPAPSFGHGQIYRWKVRAVNAWSVPGVASGTDYSNWSSWCEFEVDTVRPNKPKVVADVANVPFVTGKTIRLTVSPGGVPSDTDVASYDWWVIDGAGTHAVTRVPGPNTTINWTPIAGQGTIYVQAKDRVQYSLAATTYTFNAAQASTELARWTLSDSAGTATAVDGTGNGNDLAVSLSPASTFGAPGRTVTGPTAVHFSASMNDNVTATLAQLDISKSYTVAAWIKPDQGANGTAICKQTSSSCSIIIAKYQFDDHWNISVGDDSTGFSMSTESVAQPGVWTHLALVFDAAAKTAAIYVNGVNEMQWDDLPPWGDVPGPLRLGREEWGMPFLGSMADVRVWNRIVSSTEIAEIVDPTSPANAATDMVGQWLVEPESCFGSPVTCTDSSNYAHDINLSGGVNLTTAGQSGSGLQYTAASGVAKSIDPNTGLPGPVLHTDQSFTVSAWVKLADADPATPTPDLPTGTRTALAQSGTKVSGFYLGYRICNDGGRWSFTIPEADMDDGQDPSTPASWTHACSSTALTTANIGQWFHLIGTYDANTGQMRLYVNGTLASSATRSGARFDTAGPMTIGAAWYTGVGGTPGQLTGWSAGTIDTVMAYQGVVPASSVNRIP